MTPPTTFQICERWDGCKMLMEQDWERFPSRKSPRLKEFNYASPNYYFVTICTKGKECIFGTPKQLSPMGEVASDCLKAIESHFTGVCLDKWVVMPNHIHAIVVLSGTAVQLPAVVGQYKSATTRKIRIFAPGKIVWQASFHDHVIRNQADYERIWTYIEGNPGRWEDDCFYKAPAEQ